MQRGGTGLMLNKETQDLPKAKVRFSVSTRRLDLDSTVRNSSYYTCQYYDNNTIYDLTVMDNFGIRQTLKRKQERSGEQVLRVVREYRISHLLESEISNFFDEVSELDGNILNSIKETVSTRDFFKSKGFGHEYLKNATTGFMFCIAFDINQDQLARDLSVECQELGITISRKKRQSMPANSCYSANNNGSYNPFRGVVGNTYRMKRIVANSIKPLKERYWYFIGDTLNEVEYDSNNKLDEGLHIFDYVKRFDIDEVINYEVKSVIFDEAFNKNGFFISERDAMLASNIELASREKEVSLKEREHAMKMEDLEAQRSLNISKRELAVVKHDSDMQLLINTKEAERFKHDNTIQSLLLEQKTMLGKAELLQLTHLREITTFNNEVVIADKQHRNETLKLYAAKLKHEFTIRELVRTEEMSVIVAESKLQVMEADIIRDRIDFRRKVVEDKMKNIGFVANSTATVIKLIGK
jgi:hypothetical protein